MTPLKPLGDENYVPVEQALKDLDKLKPVKTKGARKKRKPTRRPVIGRSPSLEELPEIVRDNSGDYIGLPQLGLVVAKRQGYNNLQWKQSIKEVQKNGLILPRMDVLTSHYLNLREASEGKITLYDAAGNPIERDEATENWNYVSSTDRSPFNGKTFWTWLDALFKKDEKGKLYLVTDHRIVNGSLESKSVALEDYIKASGKLVNLVFNPQGLPTSESSLDQYTQGQNIYFWQPVEGKVAGFGAGSDWAGLGCGWDLRGSDSRLGVLVCAEGARIK